MNYDDWKTTPPDDPPPRCECKPDDEGVVLEDELCDYCRLQAKEEKRKAAEEAYWEQKISERRERER